MASLENMTNHKFGKQYKLCKKTVIDDIFQHGKTIKEYPFVLRYIKAPLDNNQPFQIVVSAPKKLHRKAVDRNKIKRLSKEALRLNKLPLESFCKSNNYQLGLFLIFSSKEILSFELMDRKIKKLINKLIQQLDEQNS